MARVPFLPELAMHSNNINLSRVLIKKKGSCSIMRTIAWLKKACNVFGQLLDLDLPEMYRQYKENTFNYCTFRKTAETSRTTC